jgi:hypothetical protein
LGRGKIFSILKNANKKFGESGLITDNYLYFSMSISEMLLHILMKRFANHWVMIPVLLFIL